VSYADRRLMLEIAEALRVMLLCVPRSVSDLAMKSANGLHEASEEVRKFQKEIDE
jgi:hypothetical protein